MVDSQKSKIIGFLSFAIVLLVFVGVSIFVVVAFFLSFKKINYNEYGILVNPYTNKLTQEVYTPGLYFFWFTYYFIKWPKLTEVLVFSDNSDNDEDNYDPDRGMLTLRSQEGVIIDMGVYVYYLYQKEGILELEMNHGEENFKEILMNEVRSVVFQVAGEYTVKDIQEDRNGFVERLNIRMKEIIENLFPITIDFCSISHVYVWDGLEESIVDKLVEEQNNQKLIFEREISKLIKEQDIVTAEGNYEILEIDTNADSQILSMEVNTDKNITILQHNRNKDLYKSIQDMYSDGSEFVNTFYWYNTVIKKDNTQLLYTLIDDYVLNVDYNNTQ